jgi:hypothetical protein
VQARGGRRSGHAGVVAAPVGPRGSESEAVLASSKPCSIASGCSPKMVAVCSLRTRLS